MEYLSSGIGLRERGRGGEREGINQNMKVSHQVRSPFNVSAYFLLLTTVANMQFGMGRFIK